MIHKVNNQTFVISGGDCWRPGSFTSREAAEFGERLPDETLAAMTAVCDDGRITLEDLRTTCYQDDSED